MCQRPLARFEAVARAEPPPPARARDFALRRALGSATSAHALSSICIGSRRTWDAGSRPGVQRAPRAREIRLRARGMCLAVSPAIIPARCRGVKADAVWFRGFGGMAHGRSLVEPGSDRIVTGIFGSRATPDWFAAFVCNYANRWCSVLFSTHGGGVRTCFTSARPPAGNGRARRSEGFLRVISRVVRLRGRHPTEEL
jgi:hypothetical protein